MNKISYPSQFNGNNIYFKVLPDSKDTGKNHSVQEDLDLVRRTKSGDRKAFDSLVVKYQEKLKCLVSRYLKLPQQIEDVVQEAFINAHYGIMSFREDSKFSTWLHRIGINSALSYLSAERRRIPLYQPALNTDTNESMVSEIADERTPEHALANIQTTKFISSALERMPKELREAIIMREIEGLSYEEIANVMDCPIGTVRSRIFRARESLAIILRPKLNSVSLNYYI